MSDVPDLDVAPAGHLSVTADRKQHDITVPGRTEITVAPGVTIYLHTKDDTDVTVFHTVEAQALIEASQAGS